MAAGKAKPKPAQPWGYMKVRGWLMFRHRMARLAGTVGSREKMVSSGKTSRMASKVRSSLPHVSFSRSTRKIHGKTPENPNLNGYEYFLSQLDPERTRLR